MTTYHLAVSEQTDTAVHMLAELNTADPVVAAATLRAVADRFDPPKPPRPVTRGRSGPIDFDDPALEGAVVRVSRDAMGRAARRPKTTLTDEPDPVVLSTTLPPVEPWMRRQAGEVPPPVTSTRDVRITGGPLAGMFQRRTGDGTDVRLTPDGCGPDHTFTGSCALTPPHRD